MVQAVMQVIDKVLLSCLLLTSCCVTQFLKGHRLVPVHGPGGLGTLALNNLQQRIKCIFFTSQEITEMLQHDEDG